MTVGAGLLMVVMDNSILYTALPTLTEQLGATGSQSLWIINAYPVVMAGLLLGAGTLGDRVGHRRMFLIGLVVFASASVIAAYAPSAGVLIGARAVLAVGAATMMPATLALIRITFQVERERNFAIAVWGSLATVGGAVGPIVGGALLEWFWWGSVFLLNVPIALAALIATFRLAPANDPDRSKTWDLTSSLFALIGLVGAVITIKELAHPPQRWALIGAAAVASIIGFTLFVRRQRVMREPLLDFVVFRNRAFSAGVLAAVFATFASGGVQLVTTQRFQLVDGFSPLEAGLIVAAVALGSLPAALLGGAFLHRVGLRTLIAGGLAVSVLGAVMVTVAAGASLPLLVVGMVVIGMGVGAATSVASTAIMGNAPASKAGMAASIEEVSYEFGSLTAVALLGSLVTFLYTLTVRLPDGAPSSAGESLSDALASAGGSTDIIDAAQRAYSCAYSWTMVAVGVVLAVVAVVTGSLLRHHGPGSRSSMYDTESS